MSLRRLLIRLVLLAVCFHTVIGLSAHEAMHIQQRLAQPAAGAFDASAVFSDAQGAVGEREVELDGVGTGTAGGHGGSAADPLCAWCVAFAQIASALAPPWPPVTFAAADAVDRRFARQDAVFVPRSDRWRFASRDPPRAPCADRSPSPSS
jgi:Tfp pilus assembly protein PilX